MHEMALVRNVVDVVLQEVDGRPVRAVRNVYLTIGELSDVVEQYVSGLFQFLARGTIAEHAEVVIRRTPAMVRCECGEIFHIDVRDTKTWECPRCHAYQKYRLFSGREFRIDSIDVDPVPPEELAAWREAQAAARKAQAAPSSSSR